MAIFLQLRTIRNADPNVVFVVDGINVKYPDDNEAKSNPFLDVVFVDADGEGWDGGKGSHDHPVLYVWPSEPSTRNGSALSAAGIKSLDKLDRPDQHHVYMNDRGVLISSTVVGSSKGDVGEQNSALILKIARKMFTDLIQVVELDKKLSELSHIIKAKKTVKSTSDIVKLGCGVPLVVGRSFSAIRFYGLVMDPFLTKGTCAGLRVLTNEERTAETTLQVRWLEGIDNAKQHAADYPLEIILIPYSKGGDALAEIKELAALRLIQAQMVPPETAKDPAIMDRMVRAVLGRMQRTAGASIREVSVDRDYKDVLEEAGKAANELNMKL